MGGGGAVTRIKGPLWEKVVSVGANQTGPENVYIPQHRVLTLLAVSVLLDNVA